MPQSVEAYVERWTSPQGAMVRGHPLDAEMTPESCILDEVIRDSIGSGAVALPDFGDAICWFLYYRMKDDATGDRQPSDELLAAHAAARSSLTALLERYCRDGYDPLLKEALMQAVNGHLRNFSLEGVHVLPGDLNAVLESFGNPLVDEDAEQRAGPEPVFDLHNPKHRAALHERIVESAQ